MIVSVVAEAQEAVCIESGDKDRTVAAIALAHTVRGAGGIVVDLVAVVRSIAVVATSVVAATAAADIVGMGLVVVALFIPLSI